ncbi:GNAT family N-acetyltransferase [Kiloniella sp.]|uniref:GNAT family N-acetyltransferase n=1 Tax=Kiloniella sp. TaxID=1938587 RepID=UPI003B015081
MYTNENGQPIGAPVKNWNERPLPPLTSVEGLHTRLEVLDPEKHSQDLYKANSRDTRGEIWGYLPYWPFESFDEYKGWVKSVAGKSDPLFFVIIDKASNKALGVASYLRITPTAGSIEVGHINYSPTLQKSIVATEAMFWHFSALLSRFRISNRA